MLATVAAVVATHNLTIGVLLSGTFFAFAEAFDFREDIDSVVIDIRHAHLWDISAIAALDRVVLKLRREGIREEVIGMNEASATIVDRLATHDKIDALDLAPGH